jgi:predicted SAM-dependent methyltransferase
MAAPGKKAPGKKANVQVETHMDRKPPEHPDGLRSVQVGCGPMHLRSNWWNTDLRPFKGIDETLDVTEPWRWSGILDYVYGEHFLEHLSMDQAIAFLTNAGQALRPGGRIRLSTPSLEWVLSTHFRLGSQDPEETIADTFRMNRAFHGWGHRFLYSRATLTWLLEQHGYRDIGCYDYGASEDPNLANLELHGGFSVANGYPSVWIVEAAKGDGAIGIGPDAKQRIEQDFSRYVRSGH